MVFALLMGCGPKIVPAVQPTRMDVELSVVVHTDGVETLPVPLQSMLAPQHWTIHLQLQTEPVRQFRDGSFGNVLRVVSADGTMHQDGQSTPLPMDLEQHAVELRMFADGELLDIDLMEHVVGHGRWLDVLDVIFPIVSSIPLHAAHGTSDQQTVQWPIQVPDQANVRNTVRLQWRYPAAVNGSAQAHYEGSMQMDGASVFSGQAQLLFGEGHVQGEIWIQQDSPVEHRFNWQRSVELGFPVGVTLIQVQDYQGRVRWL